MNAAPVAFLSHLSYHRNNRTGRSCALATAVGFVLHVKMNGLPLAAEKKIATYKQISCVK